MTITNDERDQLVKRYLEVDAKRRELDDELSRIKATLRDAYEPGYSDTTPEGIKVAVAPNRRFDVDAAAALLPDELRPLCKAEGYDPKKVKDYLAPALVEKCMREAGQPRVVIS